MCCTGQALNKHYPLRMKGSNLSSYYTTQAKKHPNNSMHIYTINEIYI